MTGSKKICPQCGSVLSFRLGQYECACGFISQPEKKAVVVKAGTSGYGFDTNTRVTDSAAPSWQLQDQTETQFDPEPRTGTASSMKTEKLILGCIVLVMPGLKVVAYSQIEAVGYSPAVMDFAVTGIAILLIFLPVKPLKLVAGVLFTLYGLLRVIGMVLFLLFGIVTAAQMYSLSPGVDMYQDYLVVMWTESIITTLLVFWLASVLLRDYYRMQLR